MTPAAALARAHAAGLTVTAEGGRLRWRGPPPPPDLLADLRAHKAALLALLTAANDTTPAPDPSDRRATIAAEGAPAATVPLDAETLAAWEAELAALLAAAPAQRITNPGPAAAYFTAEARRRLAAVRHDRVAAGLLMQFWRHARHPSA
ncbi:hypothetical protein [Acidiphilium sp.]|uniref:hypothetical protein n=1 Tax=Acidiphilium sp. TaxID=527 RepID=UPI00258D3E42|nr:hypothetical protein [Acidiphilium sp.]